MDEVRLAGPTWDNLCALRPPEHHGRGTRTGPAPSTHGPKDRTGVCDMSMNINFLQKLGVITKY